jgi:HK97 family phage portal protein
MATTAGQSFYSHDVLTPAAPPAGDGPAPPPGPEASAGTTPAQPAPWFLDWALGRNFGETGPTVNEQTALTYLAVYSCVSLIAETISALPLITYRREGKSRVRATDLDLYRVLHDEFNPRMSSPVARETMAGHLLTWGNAYAQIVRNKSGTKVLQLQPLGPDIVCPEVQDDGRVVYEVTDRKTGQVVAELESADVVHVPALGFDGLVGYSPIRVARTAIRAGMAQDREAEKFVTRGVRPPGAVKFPPGKKFKDKQEAVNYRNTFRQIHSGEDGAINVMVLEDGADWVQLGIDPEAAQMLESRKFSRAEICGLYRIPPVLIADMEKTTAWGTGIGEMIDGFIKFTLLPWMNKTEHEFNRKLFGPGADVYCQHLVDALERADIGKRTAALTQQIMWGIVSPNEAREVENRNPYPGGEVYFFPLTVGRIDEDGTVLPLPSSEPPAGDATKPPAAAAVAAPFSHAEAAALRSGDREKLAASLRRAIVAGVGRCLRKEAEAARRAANKPDGFGDWITAFYPKHREMVDETLRPILEAWDAAFGVHRLADGTPVPATAVITAHVLRSEQELLTASECKADELPAAVERLAERWQGERLAELAAEFQVPNN